MTLVDKLTAITETYYERLEDASSPVDIANINGWVVNAVMSAIMENMNENT